MFTPPTKPSGIAEVFRFFDLLYHSTVREVRKAKVNPMVGLLNDILQSMIYVAFFYFFMQIMGMRQLAVRGNEILFVMSGVFLFLVHVKAIGAVMKTKGPLNQMNLHTHVTSILNILAAALAAVYVQILAFFIILFLTHVLLEPVEIYYPAGVALSFFVAWLAGVAIGNLFLAISVFLPKTMRIVAQTFQRVNMVFSGKFSLANLIPTAMWPMFAWNPLFHTIDFARSSMFINYTATRTDISYAIYVSLGVLLAGFMVDHWTRKFASESWKARQ